MKKALLCIITVTITFIIGFYTTAFKFFYHRPETNSQISPRDKKLGDVRPPLNSEFEKFTERERDGLRGPVKMVHEQFATFIYQEGSFKRVKEGDTQVSRMTIYDFNGRKTRDQQVPTCGNADPTKHIYDQRGFLIERIDFKNFEEEDRTITSRVTYNYDIQGNLIELYGYDGEGKLQGKRAYNYKFDAYGNWIEQIPTSADQALSEGERTYGQYRKITYYKK
jgi:hypothetical protein